MEKRKRRFSSHIPNSVNNCDEERARLSEIISKWNQERFKLFEISLPNHVLEFSGVVRFFYRDSKGPFNSKCIQVSSKDTCQHIIEILVEKFRPDMKMLSNPQDFSLCEIFPDGERRLLSREEKPLLSQLNWNKDEREGYFLLSQSLSPEGQGPEGNTVQAGKKEKGKKKKSKLSIKFPKSFYKTYRVGGVEGRSKSTHVPSYPHALSVISSVAQPSCNSDRTSEVCSQLQGMHLMRTLSNPEGVLRKRRERKLEQIKNALKNPGTAPIKIYAENLIPEVPYKTLLVSPEDTAHDVIRCTLDKYHMKRDDPSDYCLVQYSIPSGASCVTTTGRDECIVEPGDYPLHRFREHQAKFPGVSVIFQLRKIDQAMRPKIIPQEVRPLPPSDSYRTRSYKRPALPCLFPMRGGKPDRQHRIQLCVNDFRLMVGSRRGFNQRADKYIALEGADILPEHCVMEGYRGVCRLVPASRNGAVYVDNNLVLEPTPLTATCVVRFGKHYDFQFFLPETVPGRSANFPMHSLRGLAPNKPAETERPSSVLESRRENMGLQRVLSDGAINEFSSLQRLSLQDDAPETIFMSDGKVISLSNYSSSNIDDFLPEDLPRPLIPSARNPRSGSRVKEEPLILPATLSFSLHSICHIIDCFITEVKCHEVSFQQAPAYALYICVRSFLNGDALCDASLSERLQGMKEMLSCSASLLKATVAQSRHIPGPLAFWINNISELLHFLRRDGEVSPHCPDVLASLMQLAAYAFRSLSESVCKEVEPHLASLFSPGPGPAQLETDPEPTESFLEMLWKPGGISSRLPSQGRSAHSLFAILDAVHNLFSSCNLNKEISRDLFLRLFHFIGSSLFNGLISDRSRASPLSISALKPRLQRLRSWTEERGVGGTAEGSLCSCLQAVRLLEECRSAVDNKKPIGEATLLNSIQIKTLLEYIQSESSLPQIQDSPTHPLILQTKISRPFKLPDTGYSSETLLGLPHGLREFLDPPIQKQLCQLHLVSLLSTGAWMKNSDLATRRLSESRSSIESTSAALLPPDCPGRGQNPSIESLHTTSARSSRGGSFPCCQDSSRYVELRLDKQDSDSIGISVVSYKMKNPWRSIILVKSVLDNPALGDGRLEPGDQIVKVDDVSLEDPGMTQEQATHILLSTGRVVHLRVLKKESVNLMFSTTNLYYSENELSDSDSISQSKIYPYATMHRTGCKTAERLQPPVSAVKNRHLLATRYEEECLSPRPNYTQYPTFPRIHRNSDYSPSLREKQLLLAQGDPSHQFDSLFPAPPHSIDSFQPPSYTLQLVPNPHHHPHFNPLRQMLPQHSHPIHWEPAPDPLSRHKLAPPSRGMPATKVDLLSRLSQDEVALASSITQRERELQEVRANIQMLQKQEMHMLSPTLHAGNVREPSLSQTTHASFVGFQPSTHLQKHCTAPHQSPPALSSPHLHNFASQHLPTHSQTSSPFLGAPPDVIQSALHSTDKHGQATNTDPVLVPDPPALDPFLPLHFQGTNLSHPMTLQDKMDFFIHKSSS